MFVDLFLFAVLGVNSGTHKCLSDREKHQSPPPQHFSKCLLEKSKFLMDASLRSDVGFLPCPHHGRVLTPPTLSIRRVITCEHSLCMCPASMPWLFLSPFQSPWCPGSPEPDTECTQQGGFCLFCLFRQLVNLWQQASVHSLPMAWY